MTKEGISYVKQKGISEYEDGWIIADTATIIDIWKCIKNSKEEGNNNDKRK